MTTTPPASGRTGPQSRADARPTQRWAGDPGCGRAGERPPLRRPPRGRPVGLPGRGPADAERLVAGVAAALAVHLNLPVGAVRLALVALTILGGQGAVLYVLLWLFVGVGTPASRRGPRAPSPFCLHSGA